MKSKPKSRRLTKACLGIGVEALHKAGLHEEARRLKAFGPAGLLDADGRGMTAETKQLHALARHILLRVIKKHSCVSISSIRVKVLRKSGDWVKADKDFDHSKYGSAWPAVIHHIDCIEPDRAEEIARLALDALGAEQLAGTAGHPPLELPRHLDVYSALALDYVRKLFEAHGLELTAKLLRDLSAVRHPSRKRQITFARHILAYVLYKRAPLSITDVAYALNRHHTSIVHAVKVVEEECYAAEPAFEEIKNAVLQAQDHEIFDEREIEVMLSTPEQVSVEQLVKAKFSPYAFMVSDFAVAQARLNNTL